MAAIRSKRPVTPTFGTRSALPSFPSRNGRKIPHFRQFCHRKNGNGPICQKCAIGLTKLPEVRGLMSGNGGSAWSDWALMVGNAESARFGRGLVDEYASNSGLDARNYERCWNWRTPWIELSEARNSFVKKPLMCEVQALVLCGRCLQRGFNRRWGDDEMGGII